ncbi:MAG: potassium channel protein [Deltaproteobacteria bacterium]|nr:potassium channel protein [Deltaproteobacteria bacterium]
MDPIKSRLYKAIGLIIFTFAFGSVGYYVVMNGRASFFDCVFMTVISLTTVGYGDVLNVMEYLPGKIFTMFLLIFGMGVILYGISSITAFFVEGEWATLLRRRRMIKRIEKLSGHYILCGAGKTGFYIAEELVKNLYQLLVVESEMENIERCQKLGEIHYLLGDASDETTLIEAGIRRAAGIVVTLPSDKDTLYVTLTARMINPSIRIVARAQDAKIAEKLKKAGANAVVSPNKIGGMRMASEMIRPSVVNFLDEMLRSPTAVTRIEEINIKPGNKFAGKTLRELNFRNTYHIHVMAVKKDGETSFEVHTDECIKEGTTLIVMGKVLDIQNAKSEAEKRTHSPG